MLVHTWRVARNYLTAAARIIAVEVGLRVYATDVLAAKLGAPLAADSTDAGVPHEADGSEFTRSQALRVATISSTLRYWPFGDTCLRRSLACGHALRSLEPKLRIGVARDENGAVRAHSWLEFDGFSLGSTDEFDYKPVRAVR